MQGQKQIYLFLMFIVFILALNFCRKAIKRDKDLKQQRDDVIKRKVEADIIEQKLKFERELQEQEINRQRDIIDRMKEHKDICYDLYIFGNRPLKNIPQSNQPDHHHHHTSTTNEKLAIEISGDAHHNTNPSDTSRKTKDKLPIPRNSTFSEPIIYLFVLVLVYFLIKAASDITHHYKMKTEHNKNNEDARRFSLQDYAERKTSKGTCNRRAILTSMDSYPKSKISQSFEERRMSRILLKNSISGGVLTEPVTPSKNINLIGGRPSALLRRCSVPAFSLHQRSIIGVRRPSIDSYSEGDSSPDLKRRVRMIHRH